MTEELQTRQKHQERRQLFSELLESGEEIEGLFQRRHTTDMLTGKRPSRRISYSSSRNPVALLREQIATYNKKKDPELHLHAEGLQFRGQIPFHYYNGYRLITDNIAMRSTQNVASLVPILLKTFVPQYESVIGDRLEHNCCILLVQGGMERELDREEKPLEIILDCSTKGLASPSYTFKTSVPLDGIINKTPLVVSSTSLVRASSEGSESPKIVDHCKVQNEADHDSLCSYGSSLSGTSNPTQSPLTRQKLHKTVSYSQQQKRTLNQVHSKLSDPSLTGSFSQPTPPSLSPDQRAPSKQKSSVGQFMEGVAKSLRSKRKPRPTSIYPEADASKIPSSHTSPLNSPAPCNNDVHFPMSTVFHIYYSQAKNAQVYKSVLVSEQCTVYDVVKQAMERYGMKFMDPRDYILYEVIGRWESVADPNMINLESCLGILGDSPTSSPARNLPLGHNTKIADGSSAPTQGKAPPAMEEFNVCYTRELGNDEQPYTMQLFHLVPEGYTRRFELRSRSSAGPGKTKKDSMLPPTTPVFGGTSHRRGESRRNKIQLETSFEFPQTLGTGGESGLVSPSNKVLPSSVPDLSLLDCSSPDSGVEFLKSSRVSTKSSVASEQSDAAAGTSFGAYPVPNSCPFLLNLGSGKDLLVYRLLGDRLILASTSLDSSSTESVSSGTQQSREDKLELAMPEVGGGKVLCSITRELIAGTMKPRFRCICDPGDVAELCPVFVNGQQLVSPMLLRPCDLIQIGERYMFMFQDHTQSHCVASGIRRWKPISWESHSRSSSSSSAISGGSSPSPKRTAAISASNLSQPSSPRVRELKVAEERLTPVIAGSSAEVVVINANVSATAKHKPVSSMKSQPGLLLDKKEPKTEYKVKNRQRGRCYSDSVSSKQVSPSVATTSYASSSLKTYRTSSSRLTAFPLDRRLMFSYTTSEEDRLLSMLITELNPVNTTFKLAPSFLLAMCTEYSLKCSGTAAASRLACKIVEHIQVTIWESTERAAEWRPTTTQACYPEMVMKTIQPMLYPILFWFGNSLELYHFFFAKRSILDLSLKLGKKEGKGENNEVSATDSNALTILELMLQHMFQRSFYPISKVLYMLLPCMLDECLLQQARGDGGTTPQAMVVSYAAEFLKGMLDLMLEVHIHTEMVAQFFANVFFFVNATMFNTLVDQGHEMGVLQSKCGAHLKTSLKHLEQWASRVGFRGIMARYMARFSTAIELIATPPQGLLKMDWDKLSSEFSALHPVQLHFLLTHYTLPQGVSSPPAHWSPPADVLNNTSEDLLHESFDNHPDFVFPTDGFVLDLNNPPQDSHLLQEFVENVKKELKGTKKSVDVVKVDGPQINTSSILSTTTTDFSQQLRETSSELSPEPPSKLRGRVKSILEPDLFSSPEMLILTGAEQQVVAPVLNEHVLTGDHRFPDGSRQVTILRGDAGFGITLVEGKDNYTGDAAIFVQSISMNTAAGKTHQVTPGDMVLAIDDQPLRGADYAIAQKYLKEAEEELSLVLAPRNPSLTS